MRLIYFAIGPARRACKKLNAENWFHTARSDLSREVIKCWRRIQTAVSRMRSHSCSASSWNWEALVRHRYGSSSTDFPYLPEHCGEKFTGDVRHTHGFIAY